MGIWAAKDCSACTQSIATTVEETVEGQEKEKRGIIDPSDIKKNYLAVAVLLILYNLYVMLLHHPWRLHSVFRFFQLILVMICLALVSHYQRLVPVSSFRLRSTPSFVVVRVSSDRSFPWYIVRWFDLICSWERFGNAMARYCAADCASAVASFFVWPFSVIHCTDRFDRYRISFDTRSSRTAIGCNTKGYRALSLPTVTENILILLRRWQ